MVGGREGAVVCLLRISSPPPRISIMDLGDTGTKGGGNLGPKRKLRILDRAESQVIRHLPLYLGKLEELANGVLVMKVDGRSGEETIYRTPPDRQALEFLVEHAKGKVPQRQEITGEGGGGIVFQAWAPPKDLPEEKKQLPESVDVVDAE